MQKKIAIGRTHTRAGMHCILQKTHTEAEEKYDEEVVAERNLCLMATNSQFLFPII